MIGARRLWGAPLIATCCGAVAADQVTYFHTDAQGSIVALSDESGEIIERRYYEPYGAVLDAAVEGPGYTGHVHDGATGLVYMQQRYYDAVLGRFLSVDPIAAITSTGTDFNRYVYASSNPYRFIDPDGRCAKVTGSHICQHSLTGKVTRFMLPAHGKTDMAKTQQAWPVPGYTRLNAADKPREGKGEFGSPRRTKAGMSTHTGIDIEAPTGARVVAPRDGAVVLIKPNPSSSYGNQVVIDHGDGIYSQSAHLDTISVKPGMLVNGGQDIGTVGRTGNTPHGGDSHLHFEIRLGVPAPRSAGGTVVDPLTHLAEP